MDKTNLNKKVTTITLSVAITLAAAIGSLHHDNRKFMQGGLHTVRAKISKLEAATMDYENDRKELRGDLVDLTKKVARQQGFIDGQTTSKPKSSLSKN
ncbi:hypothetical protein [Rubritalea profundi]|uniref:Uncharacterized protein n=1 Tax=Rubritalea profundi TaxID=1658618 RepID=A0A2S7U0J2_9BACT|nr:hypothetical protein [Rubritalea profundi]PQJ27914.1 hypothetical protein BSZ32_04970 [Rubritalea profundi]